MDVARRPYSTDARFFKDSHQVVRIRWYPVAEPVECLPFPSKINSLDWCSHPWVASGVGEVFEATRPYNGRQALPYAVGLTPCEPPVVFKDGDVLDLTRPPQLYNADGFPLCCLNQATMEGGIEWNGAAEVPDNFTCPDAEPVALPGHIITVMQANTFRYWKYDVMAGKTYRFVMIQFAGVAPWVGQAFEGPCSGLIQRAIGFPGFTDYVAATTGVNRIELNYQVLGIPPPGQAALFECTIEELP